MILIKKLGEIRGMGNIANNTRYNGIRNTLRIPGIRNNTRYEGYVEYTRYSDFGILRIW